MTFLCAVEKGLRSFGSEKFAMGTYAMDSETEWYSARLNWKKRECYIAMARHKLLGADAGYGKYIHFRWYDYVSRNLMMRTFNARHLPYSTGKKSLTGLADPKRWASPINRRKRKRGETPSSVAADLSSPASAASGASWDSEEGMWVEEA